jgi:signal recognition particle subunit SRP54
MVFEKLGETIKKATDKIASAVFVDKNLINEIVKDLQRALIQADVNVKLVKEISDKLREKGREKLKGVEKKEQLIKILHDELKKIIGGDKKELKLEKGKKQKIMLIGLYGSGKTTTIAKLTNYYKKRGFKSCILGLDVHRPAAPEQLEQLGEKHNLKVFTDKEEKNPAKIWKKFKKYAEKHDLVFIDTAGRDSLDKDLIKEIKKLDKKINPDLTLLVIPADIGQTAKKQAEKFKETLNINGVIVTRMDSTAKGGGALTACNEVDAPVFFIATGEKINDLESFSPERFISRILGMGDLETLMEKIQSTIDEKKGKKLQKRLEEGKFTLDDLYEQLKSMQGFNLSKITSLIPGIGKVKDKIPEGMLGKQEEKMKKWKHAIQSMTSEEKSNPEILKDNSRLQRIAKGAGINVSDIRSLLKQYKLIKQFAGEGMPKNLSQKQLKKMAKKFRGKF